MKTQQSKKRTILALVSEEEFNDIQAFLKKVGINQSTFIRLASQAFIDTFYRNYEESQLKEEKPENTDQDAEIEDIVFDVESFRSIAAPNRDQSFFKNETVADKYLINYAGSQFDINLVDMIKMEFFIFEELGFPHSHIINWRSPLLGLMVSYQQYCDEFGENVDQP